MGAIHGAFCLGCCWLLMALLFVGGVMNLAWIALLSLLVAGEKLLPGGRRVGQAAGLAFIGWGSLVVLA
jgi:predicted metal-binding membrane protein